MKLSSNSEFGFTLDGTCPHCHKEAAFPAVTQAFDQQNEGPYSRPVRRIAALRCIACNDYILGVIKSMHNRANDSFWWAYEAHYPLGKPNDSLPEGIPEGIAGDFKEALRCQFVNAYSAAAEMCRRAIESSCLDLGAPYREVLEDMIDWLEDKRFINPVLKDVAHKVRLGGNRGAHPWKVGQPVAKPMPVIVIEKEHAEAIVSFTWHFLEHVYVIPKRLPQYDFSKPKADPKPGRP
jgi:hypothetical protein